MSPSKAPSPPPRTGGRVFAAVVVSVAAFGSACAAPARAEEGSAAPASVGGLGSPERLRFSGLATFTPEALRRGLRGSSVFLLAGHPAADRGAFLKAVEGLVAEGYRAAGFAAVEVSARHDAGVDEVAVAVVEGERFRNGEIVVRGAREVAVEALIERLRTTAAKAPATGEAVGGGDKPTWKPGELRVVASWT